MAEGYIVNMGGGSQFIPDNSLYSVNVNKTDSKAIDSNLTNPGININSNGPVHHEGWLMKQGHIIKNWKKRFFILDGQYLSYYSNVEVYCIINYSRTQNH